MRLENKNTIVTGATGGIGFATVSRFLDEGANVMMVGRNTKKLIDAFEELGKPKKLSYSFIQEQIHLDVQPKPVILEIITKSYNPLVLN